MRTTDDTIAAIATAPGVSGLAVVRVSGAGALAAADAVFAGRGPLRDAPGHSLHHGWAIGADGARLDEVVAAVFRAPHSYTKEDVVELSCHGGRMPAARVLAALRAAGARLAAPGEFTLRAFLHGRLDLAQAEAVADLIHAETAAAHGLALSQLGGTLSRALDAVTESLADAAAEVEARVDFAEDVGGVEVPAHVVEAIVRARASLEGLLAGSAWARAVRDGVRVPLVGRPNVGKSSLFNALLGESRAIVTETPGTTRDLVSEGLEIAGVRVTLADTAGLREAREPIEAIGIARTREALAASVVALWVVDASAPLAGEDRAIAAALAAKRVVVALNKDDLPPALDAAHIAPLLNGAARAVVPVSATTGAGLPALHDALAEALGMTAADGGPGAAVGNARHIDALARAREALARAATAAAECQPGEIVALELREGLSAIGEVTGRHVADDLLDRIFARFCIGK